MNYGRIYKELIMRGKKTCRVKTLVTNPNFIYYENHHIVPKCLGGTNDKENMVLLTAREHFLAHWLLHKMHPEEVKLALAFSRCRSSSSSCKSNSYLYKYAREALAFSNSRRIWTEESKAGIRYSNSHRVCTEKTRRLRSENMKGNKNTLGHVLTEEHKAKISFWSRNMPKEAREKQFASYIRRKTEFKVCEYCGKTVSIASYDKAHGKRCSCNPNCIRPKYKNVCINCGLEFESFRKGVKYCSDKCKRKFYAKR